LTIAILFALSSGAQGFRSFHPFRAFALRSLLLYQGGFDKILPMYCVFLAFTPLVLKQFTKERTWVVGVISASLWIAVQFGVGALHRGFPGSIWERLMSAHGRRTSSWAST
jgi:hypothetical protein